MSKASSKSKITSQHLTTVFFINKIVATNLLPRGVVLLAARRRGEQL
jgi:hypothetical protein